MTTLRCILSCIWLAAIAGSVKSDDSASGNAVTPPSPTVPPGFSIELVAGPPLVDRPITAAFDDAGRLYVSDSSGSNDPVEEQLKNPSHRVVRLEDNDGDGRFDRSTVFADRMMFPEGTMFYDGSLYVSAPPAIWKLTDTNDDGIADDRTVWWDGKTLTHCANDLHGPYLGPDGFIYWCKGAFAKQTHQINGRDWTSEAAHIFRSRADGTGLEPVMTGGMDNPVDVSFTSSGERFFSSTFLIHPGNGQRDGLAHAVYGGVFGKDHGVLQGHPRTGELLPILTHMGPAAPCGLERYDSDVFGQEYVDNFFACQFNMHKVSRHVVTPSGSSFVTADSDFVASESVDFHPTDVLIDADGSMLVVDTGGWYRLCCPTSQLEKPDILGGIYRVRKTNAHVPNDPRGRQIAWYDLSVDQLWDLLADKRPAVRQRATTVLRSRRKAVEMRPFLQQFAAHNLVDLGDQRTAALARVWALGQIDTPESQGLIRNVLQHADEEVRHTALSLVSLNRDAAALARILEILANDTPANRRVAAETLGRIGNRSAVTGLLNAQFESSDRMLRHSIIFALIELADAEATRAGLASSEPQTQAVALVALDQMPNGQLESLQVVSRLDAPNPLLRESARWVAARHPEWGGDLAAWLRKQLTDLNNESESSQANALEDLLATFAPNAAIQDMMAGLVIQPDVSSTARVSVLNAMARSKPNSTPTKWLHALANLINDPGHPFLANAITTLRSLPSPAQPDAGLQLALANVAGSRQLPIEVRVEALAIISSGLPEISGDRFDLLIQCFSADSSLEAKLAATDAFSTGKLSKEQLEVLCGLIKTVGPLEMNRLFDPFVHSTNEELGLQLIATLKEAKSLPALRIDVLREKLAKYGPRVQQGLDELHALINVDLADQKRRIAELLPQVASGDVRRGQSVFNSAKAACMACHRMGYGGGLVGPDLTRIGQTRTRRDLLESILFPSLGFVRSFEPVVVITADGRVINGQIRDKTTTQLTLTTGPNQEVRLELADVDEIQPGNISVMPAGLDKQLSTQELADLIAYLERTKDN